jgi:large subunit ribosomal protein L29
MKAKDIREKSQGDMLELEKSLVRDAFQAKLKNFTNRLDDTSQIRKIRRDLARVKTLLGELHRKAQEPAPVASRAASATKTSAVRSAGKSPKATAQTETK